MFEWLKSTEIVLGLVLTALGGIGWLANWFWHRVAGRVAAGVANVVQGQKDIARRLDTVEGHIRRVDRDMDDVRLRIATVENALGNLASKEDLHALAREVSTSSAIAAQTNMKVDTLYRAALAVNRAGG